MLAKPHFLWHNDVHREWGDGKLVFIFLAYEVTYAREVAVGRLESLLESLGIHSFQIYEITAPYDLLVRAWVPARMQRHELREAIGNDHKSITIPHILDVVEIVHHWPWAKSRRGPVGEMHTPPPELLEKGLPLRELEALNAIQTANGNKPAAPKRTLPLKEYREKRILVRPPYREGIRFLVLVKVRQVDEWDALQRRLCMLLKESRSVIKDPSLYRLDDKHQFLIFGQVDQKLGTFHAISKKLVSKINDYAESGGARTYTVFFAIPGFLSFRDHLKVPSPGPDPPEVDVDKLLRRQEGQKLEFKGSAFTELHNWVVEGEEPRRSKKPATDSRNRAVNSLMRGIAGLLNAEGGILIVGALERSKYGKHKRFQELPAVEQKAIHRLCGVEVDYAGGDWDSFALALREVIDHRFDPVPSRRWLEIQPAKIAGRELAVITVRKPDEWFWVKVGGKSGDNTGGGRRSLEPEFFARIEGKTQHLSGRAMDDYKRENPRKGS